MTRPSAEGQARAWGWVAGLRSGTTTSWASWLAPAGPTAPFASGGRQLPGAQQLELLRRLNLAASAAGTRVEAGLVERVLAASAPGRGRPDLDLEGTVEATPWGFAPVDPSSLPADELLRVATNLLAEDVVTAGHPAAPRVRRSRPWRSWRAGYRLVGPPWLVDPLRAELVRRGRPPGGRRPVVHVLGGDLATAVTSGYLSRCFDEGAVPWSTWTAELVGRSGVPRRADLGRAISEWEQRVPARRLRVVLEPERLPRLLGVRRLPVAPWPSAAAVDVARRTAAPLGSLVSPAERQRLLHDTLLPRLLDDPGPPLVLPPDTLAWVRERAGRLRRRLEQAEYRVVGSPATVLPGAPDGAGSAAQARDDERTLDLVLRLLLEGRATGRGDVVAEQEVGQ